MKKLLSEQKDEFEKDDENKIFSFIAECKRHIAAVTKSLVTVEPVPDECLHSDSLGTELGSLMRQKHDLENVVLMQELMSLKVSLACVSI